MTGGENQPGSWVLKSETLDPAKPRRFDSYEPFVAAPAPLPGDGVDARITLNGQPIWPRDGWRFVPTARVTEPFDVSIDVSAGDTLAFLVNRHGGIGYDTTAFDPGITYEDGETHVASKEFSSRQGEHGWRLPSPTGGRGALGARVPADGDRRRPHRLFPAAQRRPAQVGDHTQATGPRPCHDPSQGVVARGDLHGHIPGVVPAPGPLGCGADGEWDHSRIDGPRRARLPQSAAPPGEQARHATTRGPRSCNQGACRKPWLPRRRDHLDSGHRRQLGFLLRGRARRTGDRQGGEGHVRVRSFRGRRPRRPL